MRVFGKATDETLDSDEQVVDLKWASKALADWLETGGNLRVMHSTSLYPAGVGIELDIKEDGAYITGEVVEPTAKILVSKKVLNSFSIGISQPKIITDAGAPNGRIVGGSIVEISLVDRPANPSCKFALAKGVASGEWVGEITEIDEDTRKEAEADVAKEEVHVNLEVATEVMDSNTELDKLNEALEVVNKDKTSTAMATLHDSLAKAFPEVCSGMTKAEDDTKDVASEADNDETQDPKENADEDKSVETDEEKAKKPADDPDDDAGNNEAASDDPDNDDDEDSKEGEEKAAEPEEVKTEEVAEPGVAETVSTETEPELKYVLSEIIKLRKQNKKLKKQYNELASQPDPTQAAVRGRGPVTVVTKVAEPAAEAQKRAADAAEYAERVEWLRDMATSGEPTKRSWAQSRLTSLGEEY